MFVSVCLFIEFKFVLVTCRKFSSSSFSLPFSFISVLEDPAGTRRNLPDPLFDTLSESLEPYSPGGSTRWPCGTSKRQAGVMGGSRAIDLSKMNDPSELCRTIAADLEEDVKAEKTTSEAPPASRGLMARQR